MEATDSMAKAARGPAETAIETTAAISGTPRFLDRVEMIDRLAKAMRLKSGLDLPHAYFVEQVKLQLAGSPAFDRSLLGEDEDRTTPTSSYQSADCFKAWAMRD